MARPPFLIRPVAPWQARRRAPRAHLRPAMSERRGPRASAQVRPTGRQPHNSMIAEDEAHVPTPAPTAGRIAGLRHVHENLDDAVHTVQRSSREPLPHTGCRLAIELSVGMVVAAPGQDGASKGMAVRAVSRATTVRPGRSVPRRMPPDRPPRPAARRPEQTRSRRVAQHAAPPSKASSSTRILRSAMPRRAARTASRKRPPTFFVATDWKVSPLNR